MKQKLLFIGIVMFALVGCTSTGSKPAKPDLLFLPDVVEQQQPLPDQEFQAKLSNEVFVEPEARTVDESSFLDPEAADYLAQVFCSEDLCPTGGWSQWIVLDRDSTWTLDDLAAVREALLLTRAGLSGAGLDINQILGGYRFERQNSFYLDSGPGRYAAVRHDQKRIVLADQAFRRRNRFPILHELGHIVDFQLDRSLNTRFHELTGYDSSTDAGSDALTVEGYWFRPQSEHSQTEATADAFALWIILDYGEGEIPYFQNASRTADYEQICQTIYTAIQSIQKTIATNRVANAAQE